MNWIKRLVFPRCQLCQDRIDIYDVLHGGQCVTCAACIGFAADEGVTLDFINIMQQATAVGLQGWAFREKVKDQLTRVAAEKEKRLRFYKFYLNEK